LNHGYVTVTPIHCDATDDSLFNKMSDQKHLW